MRRVASARAAWLLSLLAACGRTQGVPLAADELLAPSLQIVPAGGDVFAFGVAVRVRSDARQSPSACSFALGTTRVAATLGPEGAAAELRLQAGENAVSARCDFPDGRSAAAAPVLFRVRLSDKPRAEAHLHVQGTRLVLDATRSRSSDGSGAPLVAYTWFRDDTAEDARQPLGTGERLELPLPGARGEHAFALHVRDARGEQGVARVLLANGPEGAREQDPRAGPAWLSGAVVYGVIPPLYGSPPLAALEASLDALQELGVRALWLSPIFDAPPSDYGYAVRDSFALRAGYGDAAALERLVAAAHQRGLRVLLDLVPNHTSDQHPYFVQARALGADSRYFRFYDRDAQGQATHYFDWEHLPNLNFANPEVARFSLSTALYWLETFGIDGYRVDAAWGIRQRAPAFWPWFAAELKRVEPRSLLLAEAPARDPYYLSHGFDLAYDWTEQLGHHAWEQVFSSSSGVAARLHAAISAASEIRSDRVLRFLNNNDTGARFISRHGEPLTRVATAALLTLPGVPCLYAFDEVGAAFEPYGELAPVTQENAALRAFHRRLIALRRDEPALHGAALRALHVGAQDEVYVYLRTAGQAARPVIVALNFSAERRSLQLELPAEAGQAPAFRDALGARRVPVRGRALRLDLEPWASWVLVPET